MGKSLLGLTLLIAASLAAACSGTEFYNVSNRPFATVSNGPQNAILLDVPDSSDAVAVDAAVRSVLGATTRSRGRFARQALAMRRAGLLREGDCALFCPTVLIQSSRVGSGAPTAAHTYGGGTITFEYSGWTPQDEALLRSFESIAYPIVRQVYGDPATSITVTVMLDESMSDRESFLGGLYVTGIPSPEIRLVRYNSLISLERSFLHLMVRAFHDSAAFDYDAWEEGFGRAACVAAGELIDREIESSSPPGLEPMGLSSGEDGLYYLMTAYDSLNQPALANNRFVSSWLDDMTAHPFGGMAIPRYGMASTAWMKAYIERLRTDGQSFFRLFNEAYYAQLDTLPALCGDVPGLKLVAAGVVSEVEGIPFDSWYERQFVLDTSIAIGRKLYAFSYPAAIPMDPSTEGYSLIVFLVSYETTATGDEAPISGTVYPVYWDYRYDTDIYLSPQYESVTIDSGEGYTYPTFFVDNVGGPQRVAMDYTLGSENARVFFAAGMAGTEAVPSDLTGCIVGADGGTANVLVDAELTGTNATVSQGAFGGQLPSLLGFSRLYITYTPDTGDPVTRQVNAGPGPISVLLNTAFVDGALTHSIPAGLSMLSVPGVPFAQDAAYALSDGSGNPVVPAGQLLLARWNPLSTAAYKYDMYPKVPAFCPGRGYWIKLAAAASASVAATLPDPGGRWRIGLMPGWNQIGGPFLSAIAAEDVMVEKGNDEPVTYSQAWSTGLIGRVFWKYEPGTGYVETTSLAPWDGCWVKCNVPDGVVLTVPGPQPRSRARTAPSATVAASTQTSTWAVKLKAASAGSQSTLTAGIGISATDGFDAAFDAESPPAAGSDVSVVSLTVAGDCATDIRSAAGTKKVWDILVTPSRGRQSVSLRWSTFGKIPLLVNLTLTDLSTGRSRSVRWSSDYSFYSYDGAPRRFRLKAETLPGFGLASGVSQ